MNPNRSYLQLVHNVPRKGSQSQSEPLPSDSNVDAHHEQVEGPDMSLLRKNLALVAWIAMCLPFIIYSTLGFTGILVFLIIFS